MDSAILSAASALAGSLIGGISSLTASWLGQRGQFRAQMHFNEAAKRQALYTEFIIEASKRLTEAWSHHAEDPEVIAGLYSALERMRLTSSGEVIGAAEKVLREVTDFYADPNRTFDEVRQRIRRGAEDDPLKEFAEACRAELHALRG